MKEQKQIQPMVYQRVPGKAPLISAKKGRDIYFCTGGESSIVIRWRNIDHSDVIFGSRWSIARDLQGWFNAALSSGISLECVATMMRAPIHKWCFHH